MKPLLKSAISAMIALSISAVDRVNAGSVTGDTFQLDGDIDGSPIVGVTGIAGDVGPWDISLTIEDSGFYLYALHLKWVDGDTFDVEIEANDQFPLLFTNGVTLTLSDLDFKTAGQAVNINGATFDPTNGYSGFFYDPVNNPTAPQRPADPTVSWTSHSVTIHYGSDWGLLTIADRPTLRFHVQTASPFTLSDAVDAPALAFTTGGNGTWFPQTAVSHDGVDAAKSGTIAANQSRWMETSVSGPGTLSFWWKVVSGNVDPTHVLRFSIDGVANGQTNRFQDWNQRTLAIPAGTHALRWTYAAFSSADGTTDSGYVDQVTYIRRPLPTDFNGDGRPDFLFVKAGTGQTAIWHMNGPTFIKAVLSKTVPAGWSIVGTEDFNNDGKPDFLLFNPTSRATAIWYMNGASFISAVLPPSVPAGWVISGVADFNGDGKPDILFFNSTGRQTAIWYMNGATFIKAVLSKSVPVGWSISGLGDFNRDSKPDILLFNAKERKTTIWYMNDALFVSAVLGPNVAAPWTISGVADFNIDGKPDILFFNPSTRGIVICYMNGPALVSAVNAPTVPADWELVAP